MRHIEAVVFDMDGVLVDAREWHYLALNKALKLFGYSISPEEHEADFDGLPTRKKLEMLTKEKGLPVDKHDEVWKNKQEATFRLLESLPINTHAINIMHYLKENGWKVAVASNSIRETIIKSLHQNIKHFWINSMMKNILVGRMKTM